MSVLRLPDGVPNISKRVPNSAVCGIGATLSYMKQRGVGYEMRGGPPLAQLFNIHVAELYSSRTIYLVQEQTQ